MTWFGRRGDGDNPPATPSPCVKVCVLDRDRITCIGCFRTVEEMAAWAQASEAERAAVVARAARRREAAERRRDAGPSSSPPP